MAEHLSSNPAAAMEPSWSQVWQLPAFILGLGLLLTGVGLLVLGPREKNDFPGALDGVGQYLEAGRFKQAQDRINAILPHIEQGTPYDRARLAVLEGDLIYLEQAAQTAHLTDNDKRIADDYSQGQQLGFPMDSLHLQRWAETLVAIGQESEALKLMDHYKDQPAETRNLILRRIIEADHQNGVGRQKIAPLLERFIEQVKTEPEASKQREEQLWATGLQAQLMLDADQPRQVVDYLQRQIIEFMDRGGDGDLGPLMVLLGKSYQLDDQPEKAQRWYHQAQQKTAKDDPLNADILVGMAQIDLSEADDFHSALEKFSTAESQYAPSATPAHFDALVGRGYCEAQLGETADALEHFGQAVQSLAGATHPAPGRVTQLVNAVRGQYDLSFDKDDFALALKYLELLPPLYPPDHELPAQLLVDLASTHEKLAQKLLEHAAAMPVMGSQGKPDGGRAQVFQDAAQHFDSAADYYLRHAHAVSTSDDAAYGLSLWQAAECYDQAQDWKKSIGVYLEFIKMRPADPRRLKAMNRLGLAYQADGQFAPAIDQFRQLLAENPRDKTTVDSMVPLAQSYLATNDFDDAKRTLESVLNDNPNLTPDYDAYRQALIELGKLYYQQKEFEPAIEKLSEAVDRYGETPAGAMLRFRLADAYRCSVKNLEEAQGNEMNPAKKQALEAERTRRLEQGQILFSEVVNELDSRDPATLTPLEALSLRNAYFYRADCDYDLRRFDQAIPLYDLAAKKWENQPASLVALVQIVNAYCEMGMVDKAKVATRRARAMLERIPDDAFNDPTLPMTRQHWEDWLKWTSELGLFKSPTAAAGN